MSGSVPPTDKEEILPQWITELFNDTVSIGNSILEADLTSVIAITLISAGAGAYFGARGAQRVIERAKAKEELVEQIRNNNAALSVSFNIFNFFCGLKRQHVAKLKNDYDRLKSEVERALKDKKVIQYQANLATLQPAFVPIEQLQSIVFEKLSVIGRPLNLATWLAGIIDSLNRSIIERNEWVRAYQANPPASVREQLERYFGFPDKEGHIDYNYPMYIDAIYTQTDDCIYFSKLLIEDLTKHGADLKRDYEKQFRGKAPNVTEIDLSSVEEGLIPPSENYADWTKAFKKKK